MQRNSKMIAGVLACALMCSCLPVYQMDAKTSSKGFTISKKAGTYENAVTVKVKAKKGYTVYYTTGKKLSKGKKIKAKKTKSFTFKKTSTLRIYAVKSSKKMTTKKLKAVKNKALGKYKYKIIAKVTTAEASATEPTASGGGTAGDGTALATTSATATNVPSNTPDTTSGSTPDITSHPVSVTTPDNSQYEGDDALADYVEPTRFLYDEEDLKVSTANATKIQMPTTATGSKVTMETYEISKKNKLTITAPGIYLIQSESGETTDGLIEVDYADENAAGSVHLILNGVNLTSTNNTAPSSDTGLITIKSNVTRAIITVADGSVNTLTDTGETGIDKDDSVSTTYTAGIVCKKTPLTINGSGSLSILSTNGNGIKCTEELKILNTTVKVGGPDGASTGHNGITGKLGLAVKDADLTIHSNGDGLKTTLDETDVNEDPTLSELGNMEIEGGNFNIISENGDGISVYRTLYLNPAKLTVTTKNAAASREDSSYKGVKAGTTIFVPQTAGMIAVDTTATYSSSRASGDRNDAVADDALHCNGHIKIDGGTYELAAGDDAIHSDTGLVINGGDIRITTSYEGLESGDISINGGTIDVVARDDGLNAAGGNNGISSSGPGDWFSKGDSATSTNYQIIIRGGELTVDAEGDGIDSNGNIFFQGGTVIVNGPTSGGNGALDYGDGANYVCEISGGTLIAAGAVGMDVAPTKGSSQPAVNVKLSSQQSAGTYVVLKDSEGNTVLQAQPTKAFQSVVMSCEALKLGSSYTIYYGQNLNSLTQGDTVTFSSVSMTTGSSSGGGWGFGGGGFPR